VRHRFQAGLQYFLGNVQLRDKGERWIEIPWGTFISGREMFFRSEQTDVGWNSGATDYLRIRIDASVRRGNDG
jgi:hypothetical protein